MNLTYSVDRLYEVGWLPSDEMELEKLFDGRRYPTVAAIRKHFKGADLEQAEFGDVTELADEFGVIGEDARGADLLQENAQLRVGLD